MVYFKSISTHVDRTSETEFTIRYLILSSLHHQNKLFFILATLATRLQGQQSVLLCCPVLHHQTVRTEICLLYCPILHHRTARMAICVPILPNTAPQNCKDGNLCSYTAQYCTTKLQGWQFVFLHCPILHYQTAISNNILFAIK